jgi:outer membrane protein assembly factor BamB
VTVHIPGTAQVSYTLYTSGHAQKAFLIDLEGRVVHEWGVPFDMVWDETAAVRQLRPPSQIYIDRAIPYPNGDLLALYAAVGDTPWGYGLVKMDKDSNVLWKYLGRAHHDAAVAPDGKVYVLTHEVGQDVIEPALHLKPPRIDDYVAVLSPEGHELKRIRLLDALLRSPYGRMLDTVPWYLSLGSGDYLHANAIDVLDGSGTAKLPVATAGRLLLSFREISAIAILDLEREEVVWAARGSWQHQHDPDLLPNGNILLFDNRGHFGPDGFTRVIELDPTTEQVVWSYTGSAERPFLSEVRSSQERLASGHTLITESDGGRLLEVTPAGEVVWEYVNPARAAGADGQELIAILSSAERLAPAYFEPGLLAGAGDRP